MPTLDQLLQLLWDDYITLNPHAQRVHDLLQSRGETIHNDHIAFQTFDHPRVNIDALARPFLDLGYEPRDNYDFPAKHLAARHYEHPDQDRPRIFISQLQSEHFSDFLQQKTSELVEQIPADLPDRPDFPVAGRPWQIAFADYEKLASESEYAGWLAALGFRANHFTIDVNRLESFDSLNQLNDFLENHDFTLNDAGGKIKGSPQDMLEQSSTRAENVEIDFTDGKHPVPGCYYEFALRYRMPDGKLFSGFVAKSADKIFQSTDRQ